MIRSALGLPVIKGEGMPIIYDDGSKPGDYRPPTPLQRFKDKFFKVEDIITENWHWYWKIMHKLFKRTDGW